MHRAAHAVALAAAPASHVSIGMLAGGAQSKIEKHETMERPDLFGEMRLRPTNAKRAYLRED